MISRLYSDIRCRNARFFCSAMPDKGNHYRRAYSISEGILVPETDENNQVSGLFAWPDT